MANKPKKQIPGNDETKPPDKAKRESLNINVKKGDAKPYRTIAAQIVNTTSWAGATIQQIAASEWLDVNALVEVLQQQTKAASAGDMSQSEAMLLAQAKTLEALFYRFTRSGISQTTIPQFEAHFRLALRAQSQSRMALEALAEMKNPKSVSFVKQANIAGGHQQVNNCAPSRTGEKTIPPNKLLEVEHGERMDIRAATKAGGDDSQLATVGAIYGCANARGES